MAAFLRAHRAGLLGCFCGGAGGVGGLACLGLGLALATLGIAQFLDFSQFLLLLPASLGLRLVPGGDFGLPGRDAFLLLAAYALLIVRVGKQRLAARSGEDVQRHLGDLAAGILPTPACGFAKDSPVGKHCRGAVQAVFRQRHLYLQAPSVRLLHQIVGLGEDVVVPEVMLEDVACLVVQDELEYEPVPCIIIESADIAEDGTNRRK